MQFFLTLAKMIKSRVPSNNVCLVDLEDMQEWTCDGLYFNKKGALVLFHDRWNFSSFSFLPPYFYTTQKVCRLTKNQNQEETKKLSSRQCLESFIFQLQTITSTSATSNIMHSCRIVVIVNFFAGLAFWIAECNAFPVDFRRFVSHLLPQNKITKHKRKSPGKWKQQNKKRRGNERKEKYWICDLNNVYHFLPRFHL